jgi:hypothetical protein
MKPIKMEVKVNTQSINFDIRDDEVAYIRMGQWVYYIDNSTNEQYVSKWNTNEPDWVEKYAEWTDTP